MSSRPASKSTKALEVIHLNRKADAWRHPSNSSAPEDVMLAAYRTLAKEMCATLEITLDGQVVLYTGYVQPSLQKIVDLYEPKYIEAREPLPGDPTPEEHAYSRFQPAARPGKA